MSLYDDFDALKEKPDEVVGWSSGMKLFQSQLQLKKAATSQVIFKNLFMIQSELGNQVYSSYRRRVNSICTALSQKCFNSNISFAVHLLELYFTRYAFLFPVFSNSLFQLHLHLA